MPVGDPFEGQATAMEEFEAGLSQDYVALRLNSGEWMVMDVEMATQLGKSLVTLAQQLLERN
jgi:hypothetical protein